MKLLFLKVTLIFHLLIGFYLSSFANSRDTIQQIDLPIWKEPKGVVATEFFLGYGKIVRSGWGNYSPNERKYFSKVLPALFKRTLVLDSITGDRGLKWIFTGPREGFYVIVKNNKIEFYKQYYDSYGFNIGKTNLPIYPQSDADTISLISNRPVKAITVEMNYKFGLNIYLNGKEVIHQIFIEDIRRNQIHLTGNEGTLVARILQPKALEASVSVNPGKIYQKMLGWGGTTAPTAYNELSDAGKAMWWKYIKEYNLLCQREYPVGGELNYNLDNWDSLNYAKAHYYGDNFPDGEMSDFGYNKRIQNLGGFVIFEFWDFPNWIGDNTKEYTRAIIGYCREAVKKTGKAPQIVGIQNEIDMSEELIKKFVPALRKALDESGFAKVKIHMANAGNIGLALERASKYTRNRSVWNSIDYSASNEYDYQTYFTNPDGYDSILSQWHNQVNRPFLAVEVCVNNTKYQTDSYRVALAMGQLYQKNLTIADAKLIGYCWNLINIEQPSFGETRSLFVTSLQNGFIPVPSSDQLRVFGAYSRRIKAGMTRIETESSNKGLKIVAFKGENGLATMVVLNRSLHPINLKINWANVEFTEMEITDPYSPNLVKTFKGKDVMVESGAFVTLTNVPLND